MRDPLSFSVIIPLYNKEQYIARAIQSVMAQEWRDFEVLVVDDGSTDSGPDIVRCFLSNSRVHLLSQRNSGAGSARNLGIEAMNGDFAAFLDADDEWFPTHLGDLADAAIEHQHAEFLATGYCAALQNNKLIGHSINRDSIEEIVDYYKLATTGFAVHISGIALGANLLSNGLRFRTNAFAVEDQDLYLRVASIEKLYYNPKISTIYHNDVYNNVMSNAGWRVGFDLINEARELLDSEELPDDLKKSATDYLGWLIEHYAMAGIRSGDRAGALSLLRSAVNMYVPEGRRCRLKYLAYGIGHLPIPLAKALARLRYSRLALPIFYSRNRDPKGSGELAARTWRIASLPRDATGFTL